jgi:hypothetical protein
LHDIVAKSMEVHVFPTLAQCVLHNFIWLVDVMCGLWHFYNGGDARHISHITIGLFEMKNTSNAYMLKQVKGLLKNFGLLDKVIVCIKNEGSNFASLTNV